MITNCRVLCWSLQSQSKDSTCRALFGDFVCFKKAHEVFYVGLLKAYNAVTPERSAPQAWNRSTRKLGIQYWFDGKPDDVSWERRKSLIREIPD